MTTFMGFLYHYLRSTGKTVQENLNVWDVAAGILLVNEAGGSLNSISRDINAVMT